MIGLFLIYGIIGKFKNPQYSNFLERPFDNLNDKQIEIPELEIDEYKNNFKNQTPSIRNNKCIFPKLDYSSHKSVEASRECKIKENWGRFDRVTHVWTLNPNIKQKINKIVCNYRVINKIDDFNISMGPYKSLADGDTIKDEVVEVFCNGIDSKNKRETFENLYAQIISKLDTTKTEYSDPFSVDANGCKPLSVMILSYDSVSRVSWINRLSKTMSFMKDVMDFDILNGYNILGDGTPAGYLIIY